MSCRPKLCQRLAAQLSHPPPQPFGSNHIWISDELLSEAFNRFLRVSHTSRRYGSSVPGPLEARRRASKRRMGCAVTSASMGPPGGDFGALFGAGVSGESLENGWSWKPPGLQSNPPKPTKKSSYQWGWSAKPPEPHAEWEQLLEMQDLQDVVETSRLAFEKLLHGHPPSEVLNKARVQIMTDFLSSAEDEPSARNTSRLVRWLAGRTMTREAWQAVTALICDKIQLASLDNAELLDIIRALPLAVHWVYEDGVGHHQLHEMLVAFSARLDVRDTPDQLVDQALFEECHKITRRREECPQLVDMFSRTMRHKNSVETISENVSSTFWSIWIYGNKSVTGAQTELLSQLCHALMSIRRDMMGMVLGHSTKLVVNKREVKFTTELAALKWLRCLSSHESFMRDSAQTSAVYAELAKHLRPSQIAKHFAAHRIRYVEIVRMLLRTWLPNTNLEQLRLAHPQSVVTTSLATKDLRILRYKRRDLSIKDLPAILQDFERLDAEKRSNNPWKNLLRAFARTHICYEPIVHEILAIGKAWNEPTQVANTFRIMRDRVAMPSSIAVPLINYLLASNLPRDALIVFLQEPSVAIKDVPNLPLACLEDKRTKVDLFDLLIRQPEIVPQEHRTVNKMAITQQDADVVHLIAHDLATSHRVQFTASKLYRTVWTCYRWLQDRGATLSPLISRAMVQAGITRPLSARRWVPDERLDYILSIVERVEGVEVRERVEDLARYMRSSVHDEVLAKRFAEERAAWSSETKAMAKETRFRAKPWTKKKPVLTKDGRTFCVPKRTPDEEDQALSGTRSDAYSSKMWRPDRPIGMIRS